MSALTDLLQELEQRGVHLYQDQGELRFRAPKGVMNADLMARLKASKTELTTLLQDISDSRPVVTETLSEMSESQVAPLSFAQQRLWFLCQLEGASPVYNILMASRFQGELDVERLRQSFEYLIARHESLRTSFAENSEGVAEQRVHPQLQLDLVVEDVSGYSEQYKAELLEKAKDRVAATSFKLEDSPLSKVELIRYSQHQWVLLLVMHHIIGDGWSLGILSRELSEIYRCLSAGIQPDFEPLPTHYRDYAVWQRRPQQYQRIEQGIERWRKLLDGCEFQLDLQPGQVRPEQRSYRGSTVPVNIDTSLSVKLESLAEIHGVSLFVVLLTAYFILLQRYSGRADLLVGTQVANRNETELEGIAGFFVNTTPLRAQLNPGLLVSELLQQVNQFSLSVFDLQFVPFDRLVEALQPQRDLGSNPLVQAMLLWQNAPIKPIELDGLTMQREPLKSKAAKFDLTLELGLEQGEVQGVFEYRTDLFERSAIEKMVTHYTALLEQIVHNPQQVISELSLCDQKILKPDSFNQLQGQFQTENLISVFNNQVLKTPDAVALNDGSQILSYRELSEQSDVIAHRLIKAGIRPGSVVAVFLPRSNVYLISIFGILKAGCAYLPLDHSLPTARIHMMLSDAEAAAVISEQQVFEGYEHIQSDELQQQAQPLNVSIHADMPAYVIYTSGSTGRPKGVVVSHRSVLGLVKALHQTVYQDSVDAMPVALMASFLFDASVQQIFATLLQGHCLHICSSETRQDGAALLNYFADHNIVLSDCTPALLHILVEAGLPEAGHLSLKQLIVGGEALPPSLIAAFANGYQVQDVTVYNVYGPTECSVDTTIHRVDLHRQYTGNAVSLGSTLSHAHVEIVDCYGHRQPQGLSGEIVISGNALAQGYINQPGLTAERFIPAANGRRLYRSGDLGLINQNGELEFLGRQDDQVKVRGYRIELGEIEARLNQYPNVVQAVARISTGQPAEIIAYLVLQAEITVSELREYMAQQLPEYMIPAQFIVLDALPLNQSGKIDRQSLPDYSSVQRLCDDKGGAPQGERECVLEAVWREVLNLDVIGRDDNYFAAGGDSIKALQIVSRLRQRGWKLEVRDLFTHTTIRLIATRLVELENNQSATTDKPQGEVVISPIQQHFFDNHGCAFHHFNQAFLLNADDVDETRLEQALNRVCAVHDAFRLRFEFKENRWVQRYTEQQALTFSVVALPDVQALELHAAQVQQSFDLQHGPLFSVVYYKLPDRCYVLLVAHHLIIDAVSWRIVMEDLNAAYQQDDQWQPPLQTLSMKGWMQQCQRYCDSMDEQQRSCWQQLPVSPEIDEQGITYRDLDMVRIELDANTSSLFLTQAHQAYSTEANDLLLAALLLAYHRWSQQLTLTITLEGHGRDVLEGADVSRTVGWFTTRYPVVLEYETNSDPGLLIKRVKEALRVVPNKGFDYGVSRYLNPNGGVYPYKEPAISFNYLGQFGDLQQGQFSVAELAIGDMISPQAKPPYLIEFVGKHVAGQLSFEIAYAANVYDKQHILMFVQDFKSALLEVINHTANSGDQSLTPSDIDYDGFDISQLDDFIAQL